MYKNCFFVWLLLFSITIFSQERKLPEGYGKITLDGKTAYMNLVTGEVSYFFPQKNISLKKKNIEKQEKTSSFVTHIVQKGETLYKIARKYNVSILEIYRLNNVKAGDTLFIGQEIVFTRNKESKKKRIKTIKTEESREYHLVKKGETLYYISKKYETTLTALKRINGLKSNVIFVGQKLILN